MQLVADPGEVHVNSPALKNPKNPRQHAAQSMALSGVTGLADHTLWIFLSSSGVTGSLFWRDPSGLLLWMPLRRYVSLGKESNEGSGKPAVIW